MMYPPVMSRPPLTEAEAAADYAAYYYEELFRAPDTHFAQMANGPMDEADALHIEERARMLEAGYMDRECGWCVLRDGTGYIANRVEMPAVTPEMFSWWFVWHGLRPLRYKIWDPDDHVDLAIDEKDRARLLDPSIPLAERLWGVTHRPCEDTGTGVRTFRIRFISPAEFGFTPQALSASPVESVVCSGAGMCHSVRPFGGGVELRTRFWFGYRMENGRAVPEPSAQRPAEAIKTLALHNVKEFTRLGELLPRIYAQMKGQIHDA